SVALGVVRFRSTSFVRFSLIVCLLLLRRSGSRGRFKLLFIHRVIHRPAVAVIARQQPRPMDHCQATVWILTHFDPRLDVVSADPAFRQLEPDALIGDGVVARHDPLLLDAQDLSARFDGSTATKALSASSGGLAKRALWSAR